MSGFWKRLVCGLVWILMLNPKLIASEYPVRFKENKGQLASNIRYYAEIPAGQVFITDQGLEFFFIDFGDLKGHTHSGNTNTKVDVSGDHLDDIQGHRYKVNFLNSSSGKLFQASDRGSETYNYFIGNDKSKWSSGVKSFGKVSIGGIYQGIDLEVYSSGSGLKYDFIVQPGADPSKIKLEYEGVEKIELVDGAIHLITALGDVIEERPVSYQRREIVASQYHLEDNILSFGFPDDYDPGEKLVIDPLLIFSTYSGSAADNWGNTATFDDTGNLYSGGMTNEIRTLDPNVGPEFLGEFNFTQEAFQTVYGGIWDVAILKYDSTGSRLLYATYLGGNNLEVPQSLIVNKNGELVILGITGSDDFPITEGAYQEEFAGGSQFSLFGTGGVNYTQGSDLFLAVLSADGSQLLSSTYLGGSGNDGIISTDSGPGDNGFHNLVRNYGDNSRGDVIVDSENNIIIASRTDSRDLNLTNSLQLQHGGGEIDGLLIKMSENLNTMVWGTYFGGSGEDAILSLKLTPQDEVYFAGGTNSLDFPTVFGSLHFQPTGVTDADGFISKLSTDGQNLIASTYIGTTDYDQVYQMDLDSDGNVYVVGQTRGPYPITEGPIVDANSGQFVHKLTAELDSTLFSTVFGSGNGEPDIYITAFLVNDCNNLYISGWGSPGLTNRGIDYMRINTFGLNITSEAFQPNTDGSSFYMAVYTDDMDELLYATHLGSSSSLVHVDGGTSRFDKQGIVYHAVCASCGDGDSSFPTTKGAWAEQNGSRGCNNAAFKFDLASLNARIRTNNESLTQPNIEEGCSPFVVAFENISVGGEIFEWDFGDGMDTVSMVRDTIFHTYETPGVYNIHMRALDSSTCAEEDDAFTRIEVFETNFLVVDSLGICGGTTAQLSASGGVSYDWTPSETLSNENTAFPKAFPDSTTQYHVTITDQNGCIHQDSVMVGVIPEIDLRIDFQITDKCSEAPNLEVINLSENYETIHWDFGNGTTSDEIEPKAIFDTPGIFEVTATLSNEECSKSIKVPVNLEGIFVPNVLTPNGDGKNDLFQISSYLPLQLGIYNRYGKELFFAENYTNDWDGDDLPAGTYYFEITFPDLEVCQGWIQLMH